MLGALIGDLAAWTWEHDRECFYGHLISEDAELSPYGIALTNAANKYFFPEEDVRTDVIGTPADEQKYKGQWLMWQIAAAWYGNSLRREIPQFYCIDKEEGYAEMFMNELLRALLNGSTKKEAYDSCHSFPHLSKCWPWREDKDSKVPAEGRPGLLTHVFRAWDAFYRGYDFTSTIHNAVKWPGDIRLTSSIAGAFASAMYGCAYSYIKEKYAKDDIIQNSLYDCLFKNKDRSLQRLVHKMIESEDTGRKFFKKNCALTNVEKHQWKPAKINLEDIVFTEKQRRNLIYAWYTGWDNRYGFYLDDGWIYFYRSNVIICRFKFKEIEKDKYCITQLEDGDQGHDSEDLQGWLKYDYHFRI